MPRRIEPYRIKVVEPIPFPDAGARRRALEAADWNVFRIPADLVTIDLLTDSGVTAMSAHQWGSLFDGDEAYAGSQSFQRFERVVRDLTGLPHVIPTHQGRAAERLLFEALVTRGDVVPGNTHFDTTRANIEYFGARAVDLPCAEAADRALEAPFKGNADVAALERVLASGDRVPLVVMTCTNNSCGGQPVSLANLRAVRALCDRHGALLFIDAARFAENAWFIREREPGQGDRSPRNIARDLFSLADGCLMSAKKDGLVNIGGFVALRSADLAERVKRSMVLGEGFPTYGGLAGRDLEAMATGLQEVLDPAYLADRIGRVRALGDRLHAAGVPTVRPPGGHAIYVDARAFAPHLDPLDYPGQSLVCELYLHAGVRCVEVGQLMNGRPGPDGVEAPVAQDLVRLAIPRRVYTTSQLAYVADAVIELYEARERLRPLEIVDQPHALRHFSAKLRPRASVDDGARDAARAGAGGGGL
ncbi:MAG: tryptophanase [Deltaproteobacteria bacterium]|nr:MAG: tryptophanase [Deltaproteobacteria bacterium]